MEQWQREGINRLETSGYLPIFRSLVQSHTALLWWFRESGPLEHSICHNGTMTIFDTGSRTLAVTASHVYEQYLRDLEELGDITCQVGNVRVALEQYLIDSDSNVDLAVFGLSTVLAAGTGAISHGAISWPPSQLVEGDLIVCGGYPGSRRKPALGKVDSDFVSFIGRVSQASDDHASLCLNIPHSHWPQGEALSAAPDLGGMSGGPVFRVVSEPIERLELTGFIYECGQSFEVILARHANRVLPTGGINADA